MVSAICRGAYIVRAFGIPVNKSNFGWLPLANIFANELGGTR
jgi:hypothetical protein